MTARMPHPDQHIVRAAFGCAVQLRACHPTRHLHSTSPRLRPSSHDTPSVSTTRSPYARFGEEVSRESPARFPPPGSMRPKQSLGQNFLRDVSMATRIVDAFEDARSEACPTARVVEVGPGTGALTRLLLPRFPDMRALEIDQRAVGMLEEDYPALHVDHVDVLAVDWLAVARGEADPTGRSSVGVDPTRAEEKKEVLPSAVIGNLPYNIVSQILFALFEAPAPSVALAIVMMQREVAERLTARKRTKAYGILSVVGQLYAKPSILFAVPPTVFTPRPKVDSAMVRFDFEPHPDLDVFNTTLTDGLRLILRAAFQQRRKVMRNSLRPLCEKHNVELPERWSGRRPEELPPPEFLELTRFVFADDLASPKIVDRAVPAARPDTVWRPAVGA